MLAASCVDSQPYGVNDRNMRAFIAGLTFLICFSHAVFAGAIKYDIVTSKSLVGFTYQYGAKEIQGKFPNYNADISIDFETASNSQVDVVLNAASATAGFAFATQALRSKSVLDVGTYPNIKFVSKSVRPDGNNTIVDGLVTVRGITKPLTLQAKFLRDPETKPGERENLRIRLVGTLNRHDFGASGFPDEVGELLSINIYAQIKRR